MNTKYQEPNKETNTMVRKYKAVSTNNSLSFSIELARPDSVKTDKRTSLTISSLLMSFVMLMSMIATGLLSYHLFRQANYNVSALFTISAYFSIVLFIYALSVMNRKPALE